MARRRGIGLALMVLPLAGMFTAALPQQVREEWVARYDGPVSGDDAAIAAALMETDKDGNLLVTGWSHGDATRVDFATLKYDLEGNLLWVARFDGPRGYNSPAAIAVDDAGSVYVTGSIQSAPGPSIVTLKYNSDGQLLWANYYAGPRNYDWSTDLRVGASGRVYVAGSSGCATSSLCYQLLLLGYDSDGNELFETRYGEDVTFEHTYGQRMAVDEAEHVYISGEGGAYNKLVTTKFDSSGQLIWDAQYFSGSSSFVGAIAVNPEGEVFVAGYVTGEGRLVMATLKYAADGEAQWVKRFSSRPGYALALALDGRGNICVAGATENPSTRYREMTTVKYDADGTELWVDFYSGSGQGDGEVKAAACDPEGNCYVTGWTTNQSEDFATIRYGVSGSRDWVIEYDGPAHGSDLANTIHIDGRRNVYVTGISTGVKTQGDFAAIKYSQSP